MVTRRNFVKSGGLLTLSGVMAPSFLAQTVFGSPNAIATGVKALVVVQMGGGNDGLNTVVPFKDSTYYKARPTIAVKAEDVLPINETLGLNPNLKTMKELYDNGQMAIINGVGYPNPNYSHFRSMEIWQSAEPDTAARGGWLGRWLDNEVAKGTPDVKKFGVTIGNAGQGGGAPLAFWTEKTVTLSYNSLDRFSFKGDPAPGDREKQLATARKIYKVAGQNSVADYIRKAALDALEASDSLETIAGKYKPAVTYPKTQFAERLQKIVQLLDSDYGAKVFYVGTDGSFDTHFNEAQSHGNLLKNVSEGLDAFYKDLAARNLDTAVLTMTFSEFGRRVEENGSRGTDHGSAGPMFVLGGKGTIKPGLYGEQPSLTDLDNGNMKFTVDFRSVYSTVVSGWLNSDPEPVVGGKFPKVNFL
jgi:uncharacterized protein (DUF1501 family)